MSLPGLCRGKKRKPCSNYRWIREQDNELTRPLHCRGGRGQKRKPCSNFICDHRWIREQDNELTRPFLRRKIVRTTLQLLLREYGAEK
jgi:hypothetical protein